MERNRVGDMARNRPAQKQVFHSAVKSNNLNFIKFLQKNGIDINVRDEKGKTALIWASKLGHDDIVKFLLESGADANLADNSGMTAGHEAAMRGRLGAVRLLAKNGANMEIENKTGQRPLHFAANGWLEVTKFLVDEGVDLSKKDSNGNTALNWSMAERKNSVEIVKLLLDEGGEKLLNDRENPPVFTAARAGHIQALDYLKKRGAILTLTTSDDDTTVLHEASGYKRDEIINYLLNLGFESDVRDGDGWTPLHIAAAKGYGDITMLLLSSGADINARTLKGSTPLKLAVINKQQYEVEILVYNGADVNAKDDSGESILDIAIRNNSLHTTLYLAEQGANFADPGKAKFTLNNKIKYLIDIELQP